jgi:thiol-disulfide isomerase/thioredoxin
MAGVAASTATAEDAIDIKVVKLDAYQKAIARHTGKIVVVDFWATFCIPCKEEFPNMVKLHGDHAKNGLVCMSVSVDDPDDKAAALKFLKREKASFENLLLDEAPEKYQKELNFASVPTVLIYGKDGKLAKKFNATKPEEAFTYKDVRKIVEELLKAK